MPTFSCPQCGAAFTASHKPSACSQCGSRQMRTNRNGAPASGNLSPPKLRRSPISEPTAMTALNSSSASEAKTGYQKGNSGPGLGLGFNVFSPNLIMTWLLILFPLTLALGYGLYRVAGFPLLTIKLNHQTAQERKDAQTASISPQTAIAKHYRELNQQPDTDGWQWVFRTEIYDTAILKQTPQHTAIQVGLRYYLRNGEEICESRVFTLTPDNSRQNWRISEPKAIRAQPACTL